MAISDIEKNFLYNYSTQLLQQEMLTNQLFGASKVGQDLRSLVLGGAVRATTFTNPFEEAISGTLRADAGSTRQASRNVGEAASMVGVARTDMATIVDALADMEDIIDKINTGELEQTSAVVQADYNALQDKITGIISSSDFNGIALLDGTQWGTSQIDSNGNVHVQTSDDGGFNVTFHNVDEYSWASLVGSELDDSAGGDRAAQLALVQSFKGDMDAILSVYEGKEDSLQSQQTHLESQALLLDQAAQMRKPSDPNYSLEQLLADLIAQNTGTIFNSSG
ncbi:MAG: flagellin [Pseudodesulfovibrio sp.]|nr:flagellin [Pseudodesulfovibrio sp.]